MIIASKDEGTLRKDITASDADRSDATRLAQEQAALRRVATLVARESSPLEVFGAVAEEAARVLDTEAVGMVRFEPDGTGTLVAQSPTPWEPPPLGARFALDGENVVAQVHRTGRAARLDDWSSSTGAVAAMARERGICSSVATPIVVEGRLWGAMIAVTSQSEPLPANAESRIREFTELVATAISNAEARDQLSKLVDEHAGLRRVATLVARAVPPDKLFDSVAEEVGRLLDADLAGMIRYASDDALTVVATWAAEGEHPEVRGLWPLEGAGIATTILRTRRSAREDDWAEADGPIAAFMREQLGVSSSVGSPIIVEGDVWGALFVHSTQPRRPLPRDTESRLAHFTELVATAISNAQARAEVQRLADEQAALRRVATLVARESSPEEVFAAVAEEVGRVLELDDTRMFRFEAGGTATVVASWGRLAAALPVGSRISMEGESASGLVYQTGRPARIEDYTHATGTFAASLRDLGARSAAAAPIVVEGRLWGAMATASLHADPVPAGTEARMGQFTELVATAVSSSAAREKLAQLAEEQAALRRVATLVARGSPPADIFDAVTAELGRLLRVGSTGLVRFEDEGMVTIVAGWGRLGEVAPVGARLPVGGVNVISEVARTGRPARLDDFARDASGPIAEHARRVDARAAVGGPILVGGRLWGAMIAASLEGDTLSPDTEPRLAQFSELIATAIANAEAGVELTRVVDEQAALKRLATLVAEEAPVADLFADVVEVVTGLLGSHVDAAILRYEADDTATVVAVRGERLERGTPVGASVPADGGDIRPAVRCPILVRGGLWGAMVVAHSGAEPFPSDTERRVSQFTQLVATAIANAEARAEVRRLADEQAALRRMATLVAEGSAPSDVFDAVIDEVARLLGAAQVGLSRYESRQEISVLAIRGQQPGLLRAGIRLPLDGDSVNARILRTGRSVRLNFFEEGSGTIAELLRRDNANATIGTPIVVEGALWGMIGASWRGQDAPPADAERRLAQFAQLLATAIANADSRDQLTASRARLLTAGDEARRRVVRDLHDGAQQRLVHAILALKLAQQVLSKDTEHVGPLLAEALEHAERSNAELRELAHGILPSVLTQGGLRAGVDALVSRFDLPVEVDVPSTRLPPEVEASAYFIVAEALTNVIKHSQAARAEVTAAVAGGTLSVEVRDDGIGEADPRGHGLLGLSDRVAALGGRLRVDSPRGRGTLLAVELPLSA